MFIPIELSPADVVEAIRIYALHKLDEKDVKLPKNSTISVSVPAKLMPRVTLSLDGVDKPKAKPKAKPSNGTEPKRGRGRPRKVAAPEIPAQTPVDAVPAVAA